MGQRWPFVWLLVAPLALAAPTKPVTIHVTGAPLHEVARKLGDATGCMFFPMGGQSIDLSVDKLPLWDVLTKLEVENQIYATVQMGRVMLRDQAQPKEPTWATDWRRWGEWAIAYKPGPPGGGRLMMSPPSPTARSARLWVVGVRDATIDTVVIDAASAGKAKGNLQSKIHDAVMAPCREGVIELSIDTAAPKVSFRGHVGLKVPKTVERRVAVPAGDEVVDFAEGRLRIHVASRAQGTSRQIHVGWDGMGEPTSIGVEIVDENGQPVPDTGRGSSSGGSQGSSDRTVAVWTTGKRFAILTLASGAFTDETIPFRFDDVPLDPAP
jgi:hypothetical protein